MNFYDYHIHTQFSFDSSEIMENVCKSAIQKGIQELCFTEHYDCNYPKDKRVNLTEYYKAFHSLKHKYNDRLTLRYGIEIGQAFENLDEYRHVISAPNYDAVLASLHNLPGCEDFYFLDYSKENPDLLLKKYFNALFRIAKYMDYDILTHLDYPIRYMGVNDDILNRYKDTIAEILRIVIQRGKIIEVNTSHFDGKLVRAMPPIGILQLYIDLGGNTVSTGSDAHRAERVAANFNEIYSLLKEVGIKYIASFEKRILKQTILID